MKQGFALIITLSLMILLVIIAVGLLGLSSISLRSSGQDQARVIAAANARMALQLAIGDLQKALGPDQRISARSSLVHGTKGEPNILGAWESWRWNPFGGSGPDYVGKKKKFQRWLVSTGSPDDAANVDTMAGAIKNPVSLINAPTSGSSTTVSGEPVSQLRASMVTVRNSGKLAGGMAYAVMDESMKIPIHLPEGIKSSPAVTNEIAWRTSPPRAHPEQIVAKLAPTLTLKPEKMFDLPTSVLASEAGSKEVMERQDQFTSCSLGLETDVVNGGFKKDLTTAFESTASTTDLLGGVTAYGGITEGGPRWDYIKSHYQLYKRTALGSAGTPKVVLGSTELRAANTGFDRSPQRERLLPVIAKLQIMFSVVTHQNHIQDRVDFYNNKATNPAGNANYGCPHLVYDPVVTLYNPYDVAIELPKLRVRIWDPPVLFGFKKNGVWLRDEFAAPEGKGFQGLARFQILNEKNVNARRSFTLLMTEKTSTSATGVPGKTIRMEPGEVKVFSPWVENNWTWGLETVGGYTPRVFFDWKAENDFGNRDPRSSVPAALQPFGVASVPGWDARAGLQTDHLSYAGGRPLASRYDFEIANGMNGGWLAIKRTESFSVFAKPGRTVVDAAQPDFVVDVLAGQVEQPSSDYLRSYSFRFQDVEGEISGKSPAKIIERNFLVNDLMQLPGDPSAGGKSPFAILTMSAKTTRDPKDVTMPWLYNHPVTEGTDMNTKTIGSALDSYDLRFEEVQDFNTFPGVELDGFYGFYGASVTANKGVSNVPMFRVPLMPASSLGDLIPANLAAASALPRVTHPFGSSRAHPLLPSDAVVRKSPISGAGQMYDHAYLLNDALWDSTFFSTVASFSGGLAPTTNRKSLLTGFLAGTNKLLNPRLVPVVSTRGSSDTQANDLDQLSPKDFSRQIGGAMAIAGPFNVNCDSVNAWKGMLTSLRGEVVRGWKNYSHDSSNRSAFPRSSLPLGGDAERNSSASIDVKGQVRWAGFRALTDQQIESLAKSIVDEIRRRGAEDQAPSLSLAEFVNRRVGSSSGTHTLAGLLEAAIKSSGVNNQLLNEDSNSITGTESLHASALNGLALPEARVGRTAEGAPSVLTQGDLLMPLSGVITPRGDTFRIRAYGEARDSSGRPIARAWCEAVVQRMPEYLDPSDEASRNQSELSSKTNQNFGRRYVITSFRWLDANEI